MVRFRPRGRAARRVAAPIPRYVRRRGWFGTLIASLCFVAAGPVFVASFWLAEHGNHRRFDVFWIAVALIVVPMALRLMRADTHDSERSAHIVVLALFALIAKFLRNVRGPIYFDEIAHWSQTTQLVRTGRLFAPNSQVEIIENFPGLHLITGTSSLLSGLGVTGASWLILAIAKVLAFAGVAILASRVSGSRRVGSMAALFYGVGPATWFFNSMFSYQSISIALFIWLFVSISTMVTKPPFSRERVAWLFTSLFFGLAMNVTHHLTSYVALMVLGVYTVAHLARVVRRRESIRNVREIIVCLVFLSVFSVGWAAFQAPKIVGYLSPYLTQGVAELRSQAVANDTDPDAVAAGKHEFFGGSTIPPYEQGLGFAVPVIAMGIAACGIRSRHRIRAMRTSMIAVTLFSGVYFAAFPLLLSASGNEGGRRSWAFSGVAVSVLMGAGAVAIGDRRGARRSVVARWFIAVCVLAMAIGNIATDVNESARFPGPYTYGSDTRSQTAEGRELAHWFVRTFGPGRSVIADRYLGATLTLHGKARVERGSDEFPAWDYFTSTGVVDDYLLDRTRDRGAEFLFVDRRSALLVPELGFYLDANEPGAGRKVPLPRAAFERFDEIDWLSKVYSSDHYDVYRFLWDETPAARALRAKLGEPGA